MSGPRRIVSLLSSATEMLFGLGLGSRVLAVSHECDAPTEVNSLPRVTFSHIDAAAGGGEIDLQVRTRTAAGEPLYGIDADRLVSLRPDLIVTQAQCDVCAVRYQDVLDLVSGQPTLRGVPVVPLNPLSLEEILQDIHRLAEAASATAAGDRYVAELRARVAAVEAATAQAANRPRTAVIEWVEPLMLAGNWTPELVARAGGENLLSQAGTHSEYGSWEALRAADPEVLIVSPCGFDLARSVEEAQPLAHLPGWTDLAAVRAERVWCVDGNAYLNRSGPRIVDSLEILAHLIQPGKFEPPLDPAARAAGYCRLETIDGQLRPRR